MLATACLYDIPVASESSGAGARRHPGPARMKEFRGGGFCFIPRAASREARHSSRLSSIEAGIETRGSSAPAGPVSIGTEASDSAARRGSEGPGARLAPRAGPNSVGRSVEPRSLRLGRQNCRLQRRRGTGSARVSPSRPRASAQSRRSVATRSPQLVEPASEAFPVRVDWACRLVPTSMML
jgi:hypothetical protein